jgi:tripartite-type tricarboxylate transporter receptor subunit TctC
MAPPNLPAERVATLRRAFDQMVRDKAFLAEAEKMKAFVDPLAGEKLQDLIADIVAKFPTELVGKARAARRQPN